MWLELFLRRACSLEALEGVGNVVGHGEVHLPFLVVPVQGESEVPCAVPFFCAIIEFFNNCSQMFCVFFPHVLDAKVIDDEGEAYGACLVCP